MQYEQFTYYLSPLHQSMCDCEAGDDPAERGSDALGFESDLWASANKMRGSRGASEYKHVVLPLVFLTYIADAFEDVHSTLVETVNVASLGQITDALFNVCGQYRRNM